MGLMTTDDSLEIISYVNLCEAIENDLTYNNFKTAAEFLMNALEEWPTLDLREPLELLKELRREVKGKLTYGNLENFSMHQDIGLGQWKVEAVHALLEMFDFERKNKFDKNIELESIIEKITRHYSI